MPEDWSPSWGERTYVMGVLNATPDSFSGDGSLDSRALAQLARRMVADGADVLDIGGQSTRPGHTPISTAEELQRVLPAVRAVRDAVAVPISIDTSKAEVARQTLASGAALVNDVSMLGDPEMAGVAAQAGAWLVVVHNRRVLPGEEPLATVKRDLEGAVRGAVEAGVAPRRIVVDPGLGFGKGWRDNLEIVRRLQELRSAGFPVLVGPSRKGTIGRVLGTDVDDRLEGTLALVTACIAGGADCVRVHDVKEMARAARMTDACSRLRWVRP